MAVGLWGVLNTIAPILAPIVSLIILFLGKVIWNHERRIRQTEKSCVRHSRSLYGDEDDIQQLGLSEDLSDVIDRLERVENKIDTMHEYNSVNKDARSMCADDYNRSPDGDD